jgi:hypothetical protein
MSRSKRRTNLVRSSYLDGDDFARDLHAGGGPGLGDLDSLPAGTGFYSKLLRAIWGNSTAEFDEAVKYELTLEQQRRPHVFVRKWRF